MWNKLVGLIPSVLDMLKKKKTASTTVNDVCDIVTETALDIKFIASPNYSSRKGSKIKCIVLHHTDGSFKSAINWFQNKESGVSAHYVISRAGEIVQMVENADKAWHAGKSSWKGCTDVGPISIGIELEGDGKTPFTDEQYNVTAQLCNKLKSDFPDIKDDFIVGHKDIAPGRKIDPKPFDWGRFFKLLNS